MPETIVSNGFASVHERIKTNDGDGIYFSSNADEVISAGENDLVHVVLSRDSAKGTVEENSRSLHAGRIGR